MDNHHEIEGPELPRARMGAFRGDPPRLVAKISVTVLSTGQVEFSVSGGEEESRVIADQLRPDALPGLPQNKSVSETLSIALSRARECLTALGYQVQDLPLADTEVTLQFDVTRGISLGAFRQLHDHDQVAAHLHGDIFSALKGAFQKATDQLSTEIRALISAGGHQAAAEAVRAARNNGIAFFGLPTPDLIDALSQIDTTRLDDETALLICETRLANATRLGKYDAVEQDVQFLLTQPKWQSGPKRASLENVMAIAARARGEVEFALAIWRRLTAKPEELDAGERGWVWRNISLALPHDDPEARQAARLSVDAFLQHGDKLEAASSLMQLSQLLEYESPEAALKQLDAMMDFIDQNGLIANELRAAVHHARGNRLVELQDWKNARDEAECAIALRRDVHGAEDQLISSLHLASMAAKNMGEQADSERFDVEASELERATSSTYFSLARRVTALSGKFELAAAQALLIEVRDFGNVELISAVRVLTAIHDAQLTAAEKLGKLEALLRELERDQQADRIMHPIKLAIAITLRDEGQHARAATWLRQILDENPLDVASRDMLIDSLWKSNGWVEAAKVLKSEIAKHGEQGGLLFAYGQSLVESGDYDSAVSVLTKALSLAQDSEDMRNAILAMRERALIAGGTMKAIPIAPAKTHLTRAELESALRDYATFVAADKRMVFWVRESDRSDYEWAARPEKRAQDLLHTFLKARFQDRISVFEELATGAGRLDILLKFDGGLSAVIELKMCGFGYSSTYAASGQDQIIHYMENRACHLGYLVVHDSRLNDFGSPLIVPGATGENTVFEIFVDVRPRVSSRSRRTPPATN
ncbi:hypothetical protein QZM78_22925 [Burkholderia multivorans]|nr:hypothetical protein [Burkholderia multivorans]